MEVIIKFIQKTTVWVRAYVYDADGALADPTSITVTIVDAAGTTKVDAQAMTASTEEGEETGVYDYYYTLATDAAEGWWKGEIWATDGTGETAKKSSGSFSFEVKAGL